MRNRVFLLLLLFYNCDALTVNPPPEVLLTEETMENIIHDQLLLALCKIADWSNRWSRYS